MSTICAIDGDVIAYRAAAANERRSITATHKVTGNVSTFPHRTAFKAQIQGAFEPEEFVIEDVQEPEDISHALHSMKVSIDAICKACGADSYEIYIGGPTNFRDDLPLPTRYKGSREDLMRPVQLDNCKEYLLRNKKAILSDGEEADDMLSQRAHTGRKTGQKIIACTIDKDGYGVEGWLYNWTKMSAPVLVKGLGSIEFDEKKKLRGIGRKWFYTQWVLGDPTDCYKPCEIAGKKFGETGVFNLLNGCTTDAECVQAIYNQFKKWYDKPVTYTAWDGTEYTKSCVEIMQMYADCAHMRRWKGDQINVPTLLTKMGVSI
jgi:hypothetical protein